MLGRREFLIGCAGVPLVGPAMHAQAASRIAVAPIQVRERRLWMPVRFGGGEPHGFILDTGAFTNFIRLDLARRLKLTNVGSLPVFGLGGRIRYEAYRAPDVSLGDVRVGSLTFAAYGAELALNPRAGGLLSAALLTVADTDLDFDAGQWRLHLDGRRDRSGFERLPSSLGSRGPDAGASKIHVDVAIDGQTYRMVMDTGAPGDILLGLAAARRSGLWNDTTPFVPQRITGIGGDTVRARLVRAGTARLGGIRFDRPLVSLTSPGEEQRMEHDGLLGMGLIQRLNLSTDVGGRRLWAKRNAQPPRPERYGMSGMWLHERGGTVVVEEVSPGSPAAAAGLRRGDRIKGGTLREWIARLGGRPGDTIELPYARGQEVGTVRLTLREYL